MNLEPSWLSVGDLVLDAVDTAQMAKDKKEFVTKIVRQLAEIAHDARCQQLRRQFSEGEVTRLPDWVTEPEGVSF